MFRTYLSAALILALAGFISAAGQNAQDKNKAGQNAQDKNKAGQNAKDKDSKKQQASITKVDAKTGTVTVRMKDKNGKDVERQFKLTGDIRYFDSTGKAVAIDLFQAGDEVLVVEAEGHLRQMHRHHGDRGFIREAAEIDLAEIKLGHLAQNRAAAAAIKKFGEKVGADHSKMNQELLQLAKTHGVMLPEKLDQRHQKLAEQLSKVKGAEFDRAFSKDMISGHEHAIKCFEAEAKHGKHADVKAWAQKWLPTLQQHLQMAQDAMKTGKSSSR